MSFFDHLELAPIDPILGITLAFTNDPRTEKINLGVGTYKTAELKPYVLETVKKGEKLLLEQEVSKEYLPIEGEKTFRHETKKLIVNDAAPDEKVFVAQTVGGTAALRIGAEFLKKVGITEIYISDPTWDNHRRIFSHAGFSVGIYPYYSFEKKAFDFEKMFSFLENLPENTAVLLQGCCQNPTGFDPTMEEWQQLASLFQERKLIPFFDFAYQGFGEGIQEDAKSIRLFAKRGLEIVIASSFSKNFGLYAERVGALLVVSKEEEVAKKVESQIKVIIRGIYSNPPSHGAKVVALILSSDELRKSWIEEVNAMRLRIIEMRKNLVAQLGHRFFNIHGQKGMFSYTGLEEVQVNRLTKEFGIYLPKDGRINVAGLNHAIIPIVAKAIMTVCEM